MKKYQYEQVHMNKFIGSKSENHRKIIDEYAKKGIVILVLFLLV